jgi:hypothetical protein
MDISFEVRMQPSTLGLALPRKPQFRVPLHLPNRMSGPIAFRLAFAAGAILRNLDDFLTDCQFCHF